MPFWGVIRRDAVASLFKLYLRDWSNPTLSTGLKEYQRKRKFKKTPEPKGGRSQKHQGSLKFVIHKHAATRLHYDLRLEIGGAYKSWAVPKGPSLNPIDQRLAVHVEDHPMDYGKFEGIIPKGNYGAGSVMIWDKGTFTERTSGSRKESEVRTQTPADRQDSLPKLRSSSATCRPVDSRDPSFSIVYAQRFFFTDRPS